MIYARPPPAQREATSVAPQQQRAAGLRMLPSTATLRDVHVLRNVQVLCIVQSLRNVLGAAACLSALQCSSTAHCTQTAQCAGTGLKAHLHNVQRCAMYRCCTLHRRCAIYSYSETYNSMASHTAGPQHHSLADHRASSCPRSPSNTLPLHSGCQSRLGGTTGGSQHPGSTSNTLRLNMSDNGAADNALMEQDG